ncbi:MAG: MarR family transcriptional regulator [Negativicutes bacterium]|nr:MarR family transcriptional regulator [Negativicutes bacterium]
MSYRALGHRVGILSRLFLKRINEKMMMTGITGSQWSVIHRLRLYGTLTQTELCQQLSIEGSTVSKMIDSMEKSGWIRRTVDEKDKREKRVALTDKAEKQFPIWLEMVTELQQRGFTDISEEDIAGFDKVLDQLIKNLE